MARTPALDALLREQFSRCEREDAFEVVSPTGGVLFGVAPDGGLSDSAIEHTSFDCWPGQNDCDAGWEPDDDRRDDMAIEFADGLLHQWANDYDLPRLLRIAHRYAEIGQATAMRLAAVEFVRAGYAAYDGEAFFEVYDLGPEAHAELESLSAERGQPPFYTMTCECGDPLETVSWRCIPSPQGPDFVWEMKCRSCQSTWCVEQALPPTPQRRGRRRSRPAPQ